MYTSKLPRNQFTWESTRTVVRSQLHVHINELKPKLGFSSYIYIYTLHIHITYIAMQLL